MAGLVGSSSEDVFRKFKNHLRMLLNKTVTQAPLVLLLTPKGALLQFWQNDHSVCVKVGHGYYLYVGQTLVAVKSGSGYRLKTLAYAYRIADGPTFDDHYFFRWEYNSRQHLDSLAPRHHLHLPVKLSGTGNRILDAEALHIPSGWITVEEVIRFLIHELHVKPKTRNWDGLLRESEQTFRDWTAR